MTKKHYTLFAKMVKNVNSNIKNNILKSADDVKIYIQYYIIEILKADNVKFNEEKFLKYIG